MTSSMRAARDDAEEEKAVTTPPKPVPS